MNNKRLTDEYLEELQGILGTKTAISYNKHYIYDPFTPTQADRRRMISAKLQRMANDDYDDLDSVLFEQGTAKGRRNEKEDEDSHKRLVDDMDSIFRNIWMMMND